ncbi:MAG: hypothetical protein HYV09_22995 [Deltaproteobacteria bacterium]|nr:hypothetical protein [Deltaproteobacteria bacterium]
MSHPDRSLTSRLTRLSILEPTTREVGLRPVRWSLLALPLIAAGLVFAVREVARVERVLAAEGSRAQRVIVYEVRPGGALRVPIEPGTDVFRVVVHAVKKGTLSATGHDTRLILAAKGKKGARTDEVRLKAPGTTARVAPEEAALVVGDPIAVNFDAHGLGAGELSIALSSIADADGVLVRIYRREAVGAESIASRPERLGAEGRARLAHSAGEVDWDELDADEQTMLLGERWRRVAALPNANKGVAAHAIALAGRHPKELPTDPDPALAAWDLRGDERIALIARGKTRVRARSEADAQAKVIATVRHRDGRVDTIEGQGEVQVDVPEDYEAAIELFRSTPGALSLRASDPSKLERVVRAAGWRATQGRPVVVKAGAEPIVLRVSARRPVPRDARETFSIALDARITGGFQAASTISSTGAAGAQSTSAEQVVPLRATRARSIYDRYDVRDPDAAPTSSAVFHVLLPASATLSLTPAEGTLDLSLAELDPGADPRPVPTYPIDKPWPKMTKTGEPEWGGYVARRPSNYAAFESAEDGRVVMRLPARYVEVKEPETKAPTFRVKRPEAADVIVRHNQIFEPTTVAFEIEVPRGEPLVLPVRAFAHEKLDLVARVDGDAPARRDRGVAERVTTARSLAVEDEVRTVVVLGDDLPPGKHVLTFTPPAGKKAWVHLPWTAKPRLPGAPPPDPHWIEGELED